MPWYASTTESDGPRTSDLSPSSGYFDWDHSSNNTSPIQCDDFGGIPSPQTGRRSSLRVLPEQRSPFNSNCQVFAPPSCQDAHSTSGSQHPNTFVANYLDSQRLFDPAEQHIESATTCRMTSPLKVEQSSETNAMEAVRGEDHGVPRTGKRWKAAHRAVERRYRSNLNLKIIKLGQCIPAIRSQVVGIDESENTEDCRTTQKGKLQKGHVLSNAVDYIQSLQQLVSELEAENRQLENKVEALHVMMDDNQGATEMGQCDMPAEVLGRSLESQTLSGNESKNGLKGVVKTKAGRRVSAADVPTSFSPHRNSFSFVSENPSFASKRPKAAKGSNSRISPG